MASQPRPQTRAPPASQTQTLAAPPQPRAAPAPILRLRGAHTSRQRVQWTEDVVDNEQLNRKKSKVCCIYHRPKAVGESSDESSSSSDSDTDSDSGGGRDRKDRRHGDDCPGHGKHDRDGRPRRTRGGVDGDGDKKAARRPSPNAYERMPKVKARPTPQGGGGGSGSGPKNKA